MSSASASAPARERTLASPCQDVARVAPLPRALRWASAGVEDAVATIDCDQAGAAAPRAEGLHAHPRLRRTQRGV